MCSLHLLLFIFKLESFQSVVYCDKEGHYKLFCCSYPFIQLLYFLFNYCIVLSLLNSHTDYVPLLQAKFEQKITLEPPYSP